MGILSSISLLALLGVSQTYGQTLPVTCSGTPGLLATFFDQPTPTEPAVAMNITTYMDLESLSGVPLHANLTSPNSFSALFSGVFRPPATGLYTFQSQSDDGGRLFIDGQYIVGSWIVQNYAAGLVTAATPLHMDAGQEYLLEYDYFQDSGISHITLRYSFASGPFVVVDETVTEDCHFTPASISNFDCSTSGGGLTGYYYDNSLFAGTPTVRVDKPSAKFDFDLGTTNPFPAAISNADDFSVVWKGALKVQTSGLYRLFIKSADTVQVYLGDQLLVSSENSTNRVTHPFYLTANDYYSLELRWVENNGGLHTFLPQLSHLGLPGTNVQIFGGVNFFNCIPPQVVAPLRSSIAGGTTAPISVTLRTQPTSNVDVAVETNGNLGASPCVLTFTPSNWNIPQIVYATTNITSGELLHFTPSSSDPNYNTTSAGTSTSVYGTSGSCAKTYIPGATCTSWGDPHIITFDGNHYDQQVPGDFYLARSTDSELVIQTRQMTCGLGVSCNYVVAIKFKDAIIRVFVSASLGVPTLQYNAQASYGSGIVMSRVGDDFTFVFPNTMEIVVRSTWWGKGRTYYMSVYATIPTSYATKIRGLCGDYDASSSNDFVLKDGSSTSDFTAFVNEWFVPNSENLIEGFPDIPALELTPPSPPCQVSKCEVEVQPPSCDDCVIVPPPTPPPQPPCTITLVDAQNYCASIFLNSLYATQCAKIGVNTTSFYDACVTEVFALCDKDQATSGACSFQIACSAAPVPQCPCLCNLNGDCVADGVCNCDPKSGGDSCRNNPDSVPCSIQTTPSSGLIGDWVFISVADLPPNRQYKCKFGNKVTLSTSDVVYVDDHTVKCRAPSRVYAGVVDVIVMADGVGTNCGAQFNYTSATGQGDPHFSGFHGEKMEIKKDDNAANQLFHVYCSDDVTITTLFYEYPDKLLFMTKFWVRLGSTMFTLDLSTKPKVLTAHEPAYFVEESKRFRIDIEDGHLAWDANKLRVTYKYLKINFSTHVYLQGSRFMNIDFNVIDVPTEKATGIIGRTLERSISNEQFEQFLQFKSTVNDIIHFTCSLPRDLI